MPLRDAMYQKKLVDPGLLRAYPRDTAENLGLDTSGRAATLVCGGVIGDGTSSPAVGTSVPLTLATPPTSSPALQHTGEQSTTHRDARPITDTAMSPTTPTHAPVVPEVGARRKKVGKRLSVKKLRGESSCLDESSKVSNKSMTARSSEKLTNSHCGTEPASFLRGNRDGIEAEISSTRTVFSEVLENSSVTSLSTVSGADSSCKKAEDIVVGAVDVRELNESTDARTSQDGEQSNVDVLTDHCVEGNRWKSELTDASTGLTMIGKKPDEPIGGLGERLRDDPSQSLGEAPNDHDLGPTQESLCPSEPKDSRSSQDREPIVDDIVVLYRTLVLPPEFSSLGPVVDDAADRQLRKNAAIENEQGSSRPPRLPPAENEVFRSNEECGGPVCGGCTRQAQVKPHQIAKDVVQRPDASKRRGNGMSTMDRSNVNSPAGHADTDGKDAHRQATDCPTPGRRSQSDHTLVTSQVSSQISGLAVDQFRSSISDRARAHGRLLQGASERTL